MKITTLVILRTGECLKFEQEGRPVSLFELARQCAKKNINVMDRKEVVFVKDIFTEEIKQPVNN